MANVKYFSGTTELRHIRQMDNAAFAARFPTVIGRRADGYSKWVGYAEGATMDGHELPVERVITYKAFPSKHECNSKCMGGKVNGTCECQCGGKNHGLGGIGKPMQQLLREAA